MSLSGVEQISFELFFKGSNFLMGRYRVFNCVPERNSRGCDKSSTMLSGVFGRSKFGSISGLVGEIFTVYGKEIVENVW